MKKITIVFITIIVFAVLLISCIEINGNFKVIKILEIEGKQIKAKNYKTKIGFENNNIKVTIDPNGIDKKVFIINLPPNVDLNSENINKSFSSSELNIPYNVELKVSTKNAKGKTTTKYVRNVSAKFKKYTVSGSESNLRYKSITNGQKKVWYHNNIIDKKINITIYDQNYNEMAIFNGNNIETFEVVEKELYFSENGNLITSDWILISTF